ncbi:ABC transporter ATP-binding protein [Lichenihabitans sp. PAMC28606]|uniref:ABC transporter ATP-binding protein n=1 Tax=Lichenihabitans sp. PAMC28606 TaxID=2880932 RepID=UPI001D0B51A5|nr:ABC transporter ATP-binding protein [Lichenihabitans sp. PAMC28606]UDL95997.1 ABC transporter ATP-binding protein [Lichenihabitans sp. PAMC28606]
MRDTSKPPLLRCRNVGKTFPTETVPFLALDGIDLDIDRREFVVFLGPSGCGKSTLLYLIAGLENITSGSIESGGVAVTGPGTDRGLIFQESSLFPWMTVGENVTFGLKLQGVSLARRQEVASELLRKVGLSDAGDKRPDQLSGGMRQRAAMARALALRPEVLLLDEPFAALDVQTRSKMQDFLIEVWRDSGASMLFVTHHIDEAVALADRVVVFTARPGRIKSIVPIDMPRPRDPRSPDFRALTDHLTDLLRDEVDRAFAEQERVS